MQTAHLYSWPHKQVHFKTGDSQSSDHQFEGEPLCSLWMPRAPF